MCETSLPTSLLPSAGSQPRTLILDGEVCVFDEHLISHMHLLMDPPTDAVVTSVLSICSFRAIRTMRVPRSPRSVVPTLLTQKSHQV
jgi:hypothetical protein